jgi:hypothetical protein
MVQLKDSRAVELRMIPAMNPMRAKPKLNKGNGLEVDSNSQGHPIQIKTGRAKRMGRVSSREEIQLRSRIQMKRA